MLTGDELLRTLNELKTAAPKEAAAACGYISQTGKVQLSKFYRAVLAARGLFTEQAKKRGKAPGYQTRVQPNGSIVVNSAYTKLLGLETGTPIAINISRNSITLKIERES